MIGAHTGAGLVRRAVRRFRGGDALVRLLVPQLQAFAGYARNIPAPWLASAMDGLAVMRTIDAARRSAEGDGGWRGIEATPTRVL